MQAAVTIGGGEAVDAVILCLSKHLSVRAETEAGEAYGVGGGSRCRDDCDS